MKYHGFYLINKLHDMEEKDDWGLVNDDTSEHCFGTSEDIKMEGQWVFLLTDITMQKCAEDIYGKADHVLHMKDDPTDLVLIWTLD